MNKPLNIICALRTEQLRLAKQELKARLKSQGIKLHSYSLAELTG